MSFIEKFKKLTLQKKIGVIFLLLILVFNQFVWLFVFDIDGYLKEINKIRFLIFDFTLFITGSSLLLFDFEYKIITKKILYIIYLILFFEMSSYLMIRYTFYRNNELKKQIDHFTGDNISRFIPDMRSDYKPNSNHPDINKHGFRFGGKPKSANTYRIMCIGGSTTWGDGAPDSSDTYPAQLEFYLKSKGYEIDVINAGVPYHTSLDALMRFITLGIYSKPNMLLIHTGLNDNGPVLSKYDYKPDYTHWRDVSNKSGEVFKKLWNDFPFSISRLFLLNYLKFEAYNTVSRQTSHGPDDLMYNWEIQKHDAPNDIKKTQGLKHYFSTFLAIAKANNITPVAILINNDHNRENSVVKRTIPKERLDYAIRRTSKITMLNNAVIDSTSKANNVKVIPFDRFKPSSETFWIDHCHLDKDGIKEKAKFIGDFLINEHFIKGE